MKQIVRTDKAPQPVGPYSQGIIAGDFVYVAGQGPTNPATGQRAEGGISAETEQVLKNIQAILEVKAYDDRFDKGVLHQIISSLLVQLLNTNRFNHLYLTSVHHQGLRNFLDYVRDQEIPMTATAPFPVRPRQDGDPVADVLGMRLAHRTMLADARRLAERAEQFAAGTPGDTRALAAYVRDYADSVHHHHAV